MPAKKLSELLRDYYVKTQTPVAVVVVSTNERLIGPVHTIHVHVQAVFSKFD